MDESNEENSHEIFVNKSIKHLVRRGFNVIKPLGKGTFGDVLLVRDASNEKAAIKIVEPCYVSNGELNLWKELDHPNILPLTETIRLSAVPSFAFIMPAHHCSYEDLILNSHFYNNPKAIEITKQIFKDILMGLKYMHSNHMVHMDLKTNNILISANLTAVICDFTFLVHSNANITRYGTPLRLRPPEACMSRGKCPAVHGASFDSWTFGMLALDGLTSHASCSVPAEPRSWNLDIFPVLYHLLQPDTFANRLRKSLPGAEMRGGDISTMRNFVLMFLKHDPEDRPRARQALKHKFIKTDSYIAPEDPIWGNADIPIRENHDEKKDFPYQSHSSGYNETQESCAGDRNPYETCKDNAMLLPQKKKGFRTLIKWIRKKARVLRIPH